MLLLTTLWPVSIVADSTLSVANIEAAPGKSIYVPVSTDGNDAIVAVQFDLQLPFAKGEGDILLTDRVEDHVASLVALGGNKYRVLVTSLTNQPLKGEAGDLLSLPVTVDAAVAEGEKYAIQVSDVVLANSKGDNVCTQTHNGVLTICHAEAPDLTMEAITIGTEQIVPGEEMSIQWSVKNIGDAATQGGWSEKIFLRDVATEEEVFIGTVYCDDDVAAQGTMPRNATLTLPAVPTMDGEVAVKVTVVPNTTTGELVAYQYNNTGISAQNTMLARVLSLSAASATVREGSKARLSLSRSGNRTTAETFTLTTGTSGLLSAPSTVTIPAGASSASFEVTAVDNEVVNSLLAETVTAVAKGYAAVNYTLNVTDNEEARFTAVTDKEYYTEGEEIVIDLTAPRTATGAQTIHIGVDHPERVTLPSELVIPSGETHATLTARLADDDRPDEEQTLVFSFSADGYTTAKLPVTVADNDIPDIALTLTPNAISEAAGPTAIVGVLRRSSLTDRKITVTLSDDSKGQIYYPYTTLTLEKGVESVQFPLGVIDNNAMEGNRTVKVRAAIRMASCNCSATGEGAGVISVPLTIIDNDGPSLTLTSSSSMLLEGHAGATVLTVSRNTPADTPLTVALTSDCDDALAYDHTVMLAVGAQTASVEVEALANTSSDDDRTVTFTATADGYAQGVCWAMLTDQTLPDAQITAFTLSNNEPETGEVITADVTLTNCGATELSAQTSMDIYLKESDDLLNSTLLPEPLAPGESVTLTLRLVMPDQILHTEVYAVVNETQRVKELIYVNNTSTYLPLNIRPSFTATLSADASLYLEGDVIHLSGEASGRSFRERPVEVYILNEGSRQTLQVTTDAQGHFAVDYTLMEGLSGHFILGACYPGEGLTTAMCEVDVYGLQRKSSDFILCTTTTGEPFTQKIALINPGRMALNGMQVTTVSKPDDVTVDCSLPTTFPADGEAELTVTLTCNRASTGNDWERIVLRVTTDEGASLDITLFFYCLSPVAELACTTKNINANVTKGQTRYYPLVFTNQGKGATGPIALSLPSWMGTASASTLPSLEYGDSVTVILTITPPQEMPLNVPSKGMIGINCEGGDGISLPYTITPVSELTGSLTVDVVDEYSFYADQKPHVNGATVSICNMDGTPVATGTTDENGHFAIPSIAEGYYTLNVSAPKHDPLKRNILVDPGKQNWEEAFLAYQAVTYSWNVVETTVEDVYQIKLEAVYETQVPKPVVLVSLPPERPLPGDMVDITVVNKGIVVAKDVVCSINCSSPYYFKFTGEPMIDELMPQTSYVFHARMLRNREEGEDEDEGGSGGGGGSGSDSGDDKLDQCFAMSADVGYKSPCPGDESSESAHDAMSWGNCGTSIETISRGMTRSQTGTGDPGPIVVVDFNKQGGRWPEEFYSVLPAIGRGDECDNCLEQFEDWAIEKITDAAIGLIPYVGPAYGLWKSCGPVLKGASSGNVAVSDGIECGLSAAAEIVPVIGHKLGGKLKKGGKALSGNFDLEKMGSLLSDGLSIKGLVDDLFDMPECAKDDLKEFVSKVANNIEDYHNSKTPGIRALEDGNSSSGHIPSVFEPFVSALTLSYYEALSTIGFMMELYGSIDWLYCDVDQLSLFSDYIIHQEGDVLILDDGLRALKPDGISTDQLETFVERFNNTDRHVKGEDVGTNYINLDELIRMMDISERCEVMAQGEGYSTTVAYWNQASSDAQAFMNSGSGSVCASVKIEIDQTMVLTRQAFRGTLTVSNGSPADDMDDVRLNLVVTDSLGNVATSHEFQIDAETLTGFVGEKSLTSGWKLAAGTDGCVTVLFTPTRFAAPDEPKVWSFGGTLTYTEPNTGLTVSRPLSPVSLTVKPSPELHLTYFVQRDIMGDNPLTEDVVEPMMPSEFALLIDNVGNGDANQVSITTNQPEIKENEKGLLIDFEILSSSVNGKEQALALNRSVPADFGTIAAHSQSYAQWELQSTLLGHFVKYDASYTHVTSSGNRDLSLITGLDVHEMIHSLRFADEEGPSVAWLTNDIPDSKDAPDHLWKSDGTSQPVTALTASAATLTGSGSTWTLTVHPEADGWYYADISCALESHMTLLSVVRQSDGASIDPHNVWLTGYTLRDGRDPLRENRLHIADSIAAAGDSYVLTFEPTPKKRLEVASLSRLKEDEELLYDFSVPYVDVRFNKPIDRTSFDLDDVELLVEGKRTPLNENNGAAIIPTSSSQGTVYRVMLGSAMERTGYFNLSVSATGVIDDEGFPGTNGARMGWTQCRPGTIQQINMYEHLAETIIRGRLNDQQTSTLAEEISDPATEDVTAIDLRDCDNDDLGTLEPAAANALVWAPEGMRLGNTRHVVTNGYCTYVGLTDRKSFRPIEAFKAGRIDFPFKMSSAGFATLVLPYDCICPEGLKAYVITHEDEGYAIGEAVETIPAHTPVLLKGEAGNYTFSTIETVVAPADEPEDVMLSARYVRTQVPVGSYVLQKQGDKVAFFRVGEGQIFYSDAFRAWLTPLGGEAKSIGIRLGDNDVITIVSDDIVMDEEAIAKSTAIYDLNGRKVATVPYQSERMVVHHIRQSLPKGIYIVNGKKILN